MSEHAPLRCENCQQLVDELYELRLFSGARIQVCLTCLELLSQQSAPEPNPDSRDQDSA